VVVIGVSLVITDVENLFIPLLYLPWRMPILFPFLNSFVMVVLSSL
jgi:hypothetical protein